MTMPSERKTVRSAAELLEAGVGARALVDGHRPDGVSTATISSANRPASMAATARWWLRRANASLSSRVMPSRAATSSAVSPIDSVTLSLAANRGFVNRQPSDVSAHLAGACPRRAGLGHHPRRPGHRLDAAGDDDVGLAGPDRLRRGGDRRQPAGAQPVDGEAGHRARAARPAGPPSGRRCGCPRRPGWPRRGSTSSTTSPGRRRAAPPRRRRGPPGRPGAPRRAGRRTSREAVRTPPTRNASGTVTSCERRTALFSTERSVRY